MPAANLLALVVLIAAPPLRAAEPDCAQGDTPLVQQVQELKAVLAQPAPAAASELELVDFEVQKDAASSRWGEVLSDIEAHLPSSYGTTYRDSDAITHGHETTHGINSHLRNHYGPRGVKVNGFYLLDNRAVILEEPGMRKSEVAPYVPTSLRESRYDMYVDNRESWAMAWDDRPLYLVDEWVAYTNGSAVGVDQVNHGLWSGGWRDGMMGTIEFTVYAFALAHAVSEKDPAYWASNTQFRAFMAWQAERAMSTYREGADMGSFRWDKQDAYYQRFLESPDAEGLRSFIRQTWGDAFFEQVIAGREVSETAELTVSEGTGEPISETPEPTVSEVDELSESEDVAVTDADDEDPVVDEAELEVDDDQPPRWHRRPGPPIPRDERPWPPPWLRIGVSIGVSDTMR